jgi:hypothetical protein
MYWEVYSHHFKISIVLPSSAQSFKCFRHFQTKQYWLCTEWSVWSKQKILSSGSVSRFPEDPCRKIRTSGSPEGRRKAMLGHFKRPWAAVRIWKMTKHQITQNALNAQTSNYCKALTIRRSYSCSSCSLSLVCCLLSLLYRRWAPGPPSIDLSEDPSNSKIVLEVITSLVWLVSDR